MITSLTIAGEATYPEEGVCLNDLRKVNYLFGHNGSGKTTISRAIDGKEPRSGRQLRWHRDQKLPTAVYNCDFVARNFGDQLPGIFTLGEDTKITLDKITETKKRSRSLMTRSRIFNFSLTATVLALASGEN